MSSIKKKRILAAVLCAGTLAAFYQPAPVSAADPDRNGIPAKGLTYIDDVYGQLNVRIADSVTINGVTMSGGAVTASSGTIGGVTTEYKEYYNNNGFYLRSGYATDINGELTVDNLNAGSGEIQTTGLVRAGTVNANSGTIGGVSLSGNALSGVSTIDGASVAADGNSGLTIEGVTMNGDNLSVANNATVYGNTTVGGTLTVANHVVVGTRSVSDGEGGYVQVGQISGNSPLYVEDVLFDGTNITTTGTVNAGTLNVSGVSTVGTGSNSTTINGSTVTVGASGSATTITSTDVTLADDTKLSELGQVKDIAPAINPLNDGISGNDTVVGGLNNLNTRVDDVNDRLDHVGAMSAAIASLKTMGYDPQAPTEVAVGVGSYKGSSGLALGVFHYPNRDFMLNVSYSTSGGEKMGGIGATWKFGRKTPEKLLEEQHK